jgi:hypothetical protein
MRSTKKKTKIQIKSSCGHLIKHLAGMIIKLCYMLLSNGFWPKPTFSGDHWLPLAPLHQAWYMLGLGKGVKHEETTMPLHFRPPLASPSLATISTLLLVLEHPCSTRTPMVHGPASPSHGIGRNALAQNLPEHASTRGDRALAAQGRARTPSTRSTPSSPCIPTPASSIASLPSTS